MTVIQLSQPVKSNNSISKVEDRSPIQAQWEIRLAQDCALQAATTRSSILNWLLGENAEQWETLDDRQLQLVQQGRDYRLRILSARYLGLPPERAYKNLIQRLGGVSVLHSKIRALIALSRDRQQTVSDVLQEVLQELLQRDRYIQQQIAWINNCTCNPRLRDSLLFASIEEYCLRPVRNQPLIAYRFVNYLRNSQKGGITNFPQGELVKLISDEVIGIDDDDSAWSYLDLQAQENYLQQQTSAENQNARDRVRAAFKDHLVENVSAEAGAWLELYLHGYTPAAIATAIGMDVQQIYRLRQTIEYHAIKVFAIKANPELVAQWLQTSLIENNFGLTPHQWENFWTKLTPRQLQILTSLKSGLSVKEIGTEIKLKTDRVVGQLRRIYSAAQSIRITPDLKIDRFQT